MAKMMVYSIYDSKVCFFDRPLFMRNRGEAMRAWEEAANNAESKVSAHPHDYALMELGEFDDNTGLFALHEQPKLLSLGKQVKIPKE